MVLNVQDLRRKYGTHAVGHIQARALHWRKLAHLLHTEQPVGKLTSTQLTQAYIEQHGIRPALQLHTDHYIHTYIIVRYSHTDHCLVTSVTYDQQQPVLRNVLAPKRPQPPATLPETAWHGPNTPQHPMPLSLCQLPASHSTSHGPAARDASMILGHLVIGMHWSPSTHQPWERVTHRRSARTSPVVRGYNYT
jgi:hypothetical protein